MGPPQRNAPARTKRDSHSRTAAPRPIDGRAEKTKGCAGGDNVYRALLNPAPRRQKVLALFLLSFLSWFLVSSRRSGRKLGTQ